MIYGVPSCHFHFPWIGFLAAILKWDINQRNYWFPLLSYAQHPQRVQLFSKVEFKFHTYTYSIFFTPFFTAVYIVERLLLKSIYILNKEILQFLGLNPRFILESGFKSRAGFNSARAVYVCTIYFLPAYFLSFAYTGIPRFPRFRFPQF